MPFLFQCLESIIKSELLCSVMLLVCSLCYIYSYSLPKCDHVTNHGMDMHMDGSLCMDSVVHHMHPIHLMHVKTIYVNVTSACLQLDPPSQFGQIQNALLKQFIELNALTPGYEIRKLFRILTINHVIFTL